MVENALDDRLTVLPNWSLFLDRVGRSLERARRHTDYLFAVLFVDLDRFRLVNESLGHALGNQLLTEIAYRLRKCLRTVDTVARFGGDKCWSQKWFNRKRNKRKRIPGQRRRGKLKELWRFDAKPNP